MTEENWFVQITQQGDKNLQGIQIFCNDHFIGGMNNISPEDAEILKNKIEAEDKVKQ